LALDDIRRPVDDGKQKGYLTLNQGNDLIPHDVHSPEGLEDTRPRWHNRQMKGRDPIGIAASA